MKIPPKEIDNFIKKTFENYAACLIYGNDYGLVTEKVRAVINSSKKETFDPNFNFIRLDYKKIHEDITILNNEINSISFNNHKKIIHINYNSGIIRKELFTLVESNQHAIIIISAEELPPSSSLRKIFEKSKKLACLACYHDTEITIKNLIIQALQRNNYKFTSKAVEYLASRLGNDHQIVLNEIEKILLYFADNNNIRYEQIIEFYNDANNELAVDNLLLYLVKANIAKFLNELYSTLSNEKNHIYVIRQIINFFHKVRTIKSAMQNGKSESEALSIITPPIFYKNIPTYRLALQKLNLKKIDYLISELIRLEIRCKTININPLIFIEKFTYNNYKIFI